MIIIMYIDIINNGDICTFLLLLQ